MKFTRNFIELSKKDVKIAGGKGISLGEMAAAGIPVPPGFVILAGAFNEFLQEVGLHDVIEQTLKDLDHKETEQVENVSEKIQSLILKSSFPEKLKKEILIEYKKLDAELVAVRSSATGDDPESSAWAGQLDTYLNTGEENLLQNIQKCWASLFIPRALFYRFEEKLHTKKISVAVIIQTMVQSEISGIAFSVHPVTENVDHLIIEASYGLGEAIVTGQIIPDSYVINKETNEIVETHISEKSRAFVLGKRGSGNMWIHIPEPKASLPALAEEEIQKLSEFILRIEKECNYPCDIEWALAKGTFYILQSRPIATLIKRKEPIR